MAHASSRGAGARGLGRDGTYARRSLVGDDDAASQAIAILRTFRGKIEAGIEVVGDGYADRVSLVVEDRHLGGELGGDTLTITPANLGLVNWALARGRELPIAIEPAPQDDSGYSIPRAYSRENINQILARVRRAIDRVTREAA